jgi:hypothetical protein
VSDNPLNLLQISAKRAGIPNSFPVSVAAGRNAPTLMRDWTPTNHFNGLDRSRKFTGRSAIIPTKWLLLFSSALER